MQSNNTPIIDHEFKKYRPLYGDGQIYEFYSSEQFDYTGTFESEWMDEETPDFNDDDLFELSDNEDEGDTCGWNEFCGDEIHK